MGITSVLIAAATTSTTESRTATTSQLLIQRLAAQQRVVCVLVIPFPRQLQGERGIMPKSVRKGKSLAGATSLINIKIHSKIICLGCSVAKATLQNFGLPCSSKLFPYPSLEGPRLRTLQMGDGQRRVPASLPSHLWRFPQCHRREVKWARCGQSKADSQRLLHSGCPEPPQCSEF